jgi:hypothetical protein
MLRSRPADRLLVSLRSPLPLLVAGLGVALLVIAAVTLPPRSPAPDPTRLENISGQEALTLVANAMRSGDAAIQVVDQGQTRFDDGTWYVTVGQAQFHFSQRNRIVVADNKAAERLMYTGQS